MAYEEFNNEGESYPIIDGELSRLNKLFSELKYPYDVRGETPEEALEREKFIEEHTKEDGSIETDWYTLRPEEGNLQEPFDE